MTGEQRYRQLVTENRLIAQRELKAFMDGELEILPCSGDRFREAIIAEFDRLQSELDDANAVLMAAGIDGACRYELLQQTKGQPTGRGLL